MSFLLLLIILFAPPIDPDLGWHLKMGEIIYNTRSVPIYNLFSYTMPAYTWADSYWLTQVVMYTVYKFGGIILLTSVFSIISAFSLLLAREKKFPVSLKELGILLIFSLLIKPTHMGVRPLVFSSFLLVIVWNILKDFLYNKSVKGLIFIPFVFLIWANIHADFVAGLLLVAGILFVETFLFILKKNSQPGRNIILLLCSFVLSALATFINPYKDFLWKTLLKETQPLQFKHIAEWTSLSNKDAYLYLYLLIFSFTFIILWYKKKELSLGELLAIAVAGIATIRFTYAIRPFALLSLGLWFRYFNTQTFLGKTITLPPNNSLFIKGMFRLYGGMFIIYILYTFAFTLYACSNQNKIFLVGGYPLRAVAFLKENSYQGNMFNYYGWGGFLIWKYPEAQTFVDGRMPSWNKRGQNAFADYIDITTVKINAGELIRKYKIDFFLIRKDSLLSKTLEQNNFWEKVYSDNISVIYKRTAEW
ncbi:hypothetical protein AUJ94_01180 [bacterium CG2_30_40_12]|nr:MAG: hypothetical protein AUJ94_01180 [bacterium CG2_30_40_12]OJI08786.1 MAG: hypothetical protein BK003_01850 [bacterium CG09_39_24]